MVTRDSRVGLESRAYRDCKVLVVSELKVSSDRRAISGILDLQA